MSRRLFVNRLQGANAQAKAICGLADFEAKNCQKFCRNLAPLKRPLFNDRLDREGYFPVGRW